jgi:hypothetical protein
VQCAAARLPVLAREDRAAGPLRASLIPIQAALPSGLWLAIGERLLSARANACFRSNFIDGFLNQQRRLACQLKVFQTSAV